MIPRIDLSDLRIITNHFSDTHKIGRGGYGEVYKAVYKKEEIAVKLLDSAKEIDDKQFMNELSNHMKVQHPNIVRLVGYCNEVTSEYIEQKDGPPVFGKHIYKVLCFEYMHGTSLDKHLYGNSLGHDWPTHYQIIKGTCEGLCYLHCGCERPILHLDLKPANILLDKRKNPKIADFGLSRIYTTSRTHVKVIGSVSGTTNYMAPEVRKEGVVSDKADVFSLGVTIIDVIGGSRGLETYHEHGAKKFVEYVCTYWRERDNTADLYQVETCTKIAICCVHTDRHQRPTMKEIMVNLNDMETQVLGKGLHTLTVNSSGRHVPNKLSSDNSGRGPLDVVIVYAFDCTDWTPAWYTVDNGIFWMVQEKLTHFPDSCMGYIYVMSTANTYTSDMKVVDSAETKETGYTGFARRRTTCTKNMASGLAEAHKMISSRGHHNGIILFFSDGLMNEGDFFDGTNNFISEVPVHTFTLAGDTYNNVLQSIAANSPGGKFHTKPVPERPNLSTPFSKLLDSLLGGTPEDVERPLGSISGRDPLDVVMVYAFDCTDSTPAWYTVDSGVFWLVQEKLTHYVDSCMGYIYVMSTPNTYTSDMKVVDSAETKETGYTGFARRRMTCTKNMASGLVEAHKMVSSRGYRNGIILFFSDGLINKGDFFDGTEKFVSTVPVHTFTLGGDAYNQGLQDIAKNSPGGTFTRLPVPERPHLSAPFSKLLDSLLGGTMD
ncbi:uncharacterized protein [Aegilops tauschii subsp. strangulata]|uniref:non-specific serine/threonine protein kinase n=1 Tax=Aegilops tauschii subsp. strangulata TaxID=200361 RepID=A0A453T5Y4_AEGTS|nr:uncharacterized protein LOC109753478 [Aegilops tauschii subsp. strangulata]